MLQIGKVLNTEGEYALIHVEKKSGCGGKQCPLSSSLIDDSQSDFYIIRARNDIGASSGDLVLVEVKDTTVLSIAFFLYIFPLFLSLGVYFLLEALFARHLLPLLGLFGSMAMSFLILKRLNTRFSVEYRIAALAGSKGCNTCPFLLGRRTT